LFETLHRGLPNGNADDQFGWLVRPGTHGRSDNSRSTHV